MIVQVLPDREQVVVELSNLLVLAKHLDRVHLAVNHCIEALDQLVLELISELILRKVT